MIYSTSNQGQYIQNMFIRIYHSGTIHNFNIWAYGENKLVRGSGLFINKTGFSTYHHFLLPKNEKLDFLEGNYKIEIFAESINKTKKLFEETLILSKKQSEDLKRGYAIYFNWAANSKKYVSHTENNL
ncbi:MAG: hypothetical protein GYB37_02630 [Algicola sp.]|nr:hypothetical protein [Algicola sp.]